MKQLQVTGRGRLGESQPLKAVMKAAADALAAVNPSTLIKTHVKRKRNTLIVDGRKISLKQFSDIVVLAAGKAAVPMASAMLELLKGFSVRGVVVVPRGVEATGLRPLEVVHGGHPSPDAGSLRAAEKILQHAAECSPTSLAFVLVSGGSSALMTLPADGLTLEDKRKVTEELLRAGAIIHEINTVRKHLSKIKGGMLAKTLNCTTISLILSDVVGDRVDVIGSGPTAPDPTTYRDAYNILRRHGVEATENVWRRLESGIQGRIPETPKPGDPCFRKVTNIVVGGNVDAVKAAATSMRKNGFHVLALTSGLTGEAREVAKLFAALAWDITMHKIPLRKPAAVVAGGETTVTVKGAGKGGRNQELVLATAIHMQQIPHYVFASIGTDGVDGPTDATGAAATSQTIKNALKQNINPITYLENNDSYSFFNQVGGLIKTGPTNTNVGDLIILVVS
ncbi:MAG: glycerate kinase [Candidatus Caldarchaeum sp.]